MYSYTSHEYDDLDGNRGYTVWNHVIEPEDTPNIVQQIKEELQYFEDPKDYPSTVSVHLYCSVNEELVIVDVDVKDYLEYL